jgi:hypothetical protein
MSYELMQMYVKLVLNWVLLFTATPHTIKDYRRLVGRRFVQVDAHNGAAQNGELYGLQKIRSDVCILILLYAHCLLSCY